jgi:hypothetical protein
MTLLNTADKVYIGGTAADRVYLGANLVWEPAPAGIVAPVFRSNWLSTYTSRPAMIYATKPAGTVEHDIILVAIGHGKSTPALADVVPPAGFTKIGASTVVSDAANFSVKFEVFWKRATASEPADYGFDVWGGSNNQVYSAAYSGCPTSGSPIDVFSQNIHTMAPVNDGKGNAGRGLSVITTQPNDKLLWLGHNWDATGLTPPSLDGGSVFMTERADHLIYSADETVAAVGATGDYTQTQASTGPWVACLIALKGA